MGVIHPSLEFVGVEILTTFWFLCHNFSPRYARKPIKGSKDSDDSLVSKNKFEPKNWLIGLAPRAGVLGKVGHNNAKTPPLVTSPQENPKPKTEIFFQSKLEDFLNP